MDSICQVSSRDGCQEAYLVFVKSEVGPLAPCGFCTVNGLRNFTEVLFCTTAAKREVCRSLSVDSSGMVLESKGQEWANTPGS